MAKRLDENLGSVGYDNLIGGTFPATEVFRVTIRKEAAEVKTYQRGTVLALSGGAAGDGLFVILGTEAAENEELVANCVLSDDVIVGTDSDELALAYRTGHFNRNRLITADGYELTDADLEALRSVGILTSEALCL